MFKYYVSSLKEFYKGFIGYLWIAFMLTYCVKLLKYFLEAEDATWEKVYLFLMASLIIALSIRMYKHLE